MPMIFFQTSLPPYSLFPYNYIFPSPIYLFHSNYVPVETLSHNETGVQLCGLQVKRLRGQQSQYRMFRRWEKFGHLSLDPTNLTSWNFPIYYWLAQIFLHNTGWFRKINSPLIHVVGRSFCLYTDSLFVQIGDSNDKCCSSLKGECWNEDETHAAQQSPAQF
jgi:hypothetical protein